MWSWLLRLLGLSGASTRSASPSVPIEPDDWNGTILSAEEYR